MSVTIIDDRGLWDRFVDDSPYGTIFHKWDFLKIIEKHGGFKLFPYGVYKGNELICLFPLFLRKYRGMRLLFSPPPGSMVPFMGFVMSSAYDRLRQGRKESYLKTVAEEMDKEIKRFSPNYIYIYTVPNFSDIRPFMWNSYGVKVSYEYSIDLNKSLDELWAGFEASCKRKIKDCKGLSLELRQVSDTETFCSIMADQLARKGVKFQSMGPAYLRDILAAFPENIRLYFLYNGSEIAGINTVVEYKGKLVGWTGSANSNGNGFFNEYSKWEFIKLAKAKGLKEFQIPGGDEERLAVFKSKFNPSTQMDFVLTKKDALGTVAEWAYNNVVKGWI